MATAESNGTPPLLVFADDWGRHPSSCQHLVRHLLPRYHVSWVNTIGMRGPRLNLFTVRRAWQKLRHWSAGSRAVNGQSGSLPRNLTVHDPKMWPWFRRRYDRWVNRRLLLRGLAPVVNPAMPVAITTIPIVADLIGRLPVRRWIYYCVDDFSLWPGLDQAAMEAMEHKLIQKADKLVVAAESQRQRLARHGRQAELLTHGVDVDFWRAGTAPRTTPLLANLQRPLVLFWGAIDQRTDAALVQRLAADLARGTIVLVGPLHDPDPALLAAPRVVHLPPQPVECLPGLAAEASVLIAPYCDSSATRAIEPLKLKEYLATGKPVVARELPSTRPWQDCLDLACSAEEFSRLVISRLGGEPTDCQRQARRRLESESWAAKAQCFEEFILS
jgi:glycosyltransferase involved in cell wall biosynthesis